MSKKLENRGIVLMGASGGIGSATALRLARPNVNMAICSIDQKGLQELAEALVEKGAKVLSKVVDVTKEEDVSSFISQAAKMFGKLDILINFAGLSVTATIEEMTEADYDKVMDVNVKGMFFGVKHFVPLVDLERGGQIINFGSMAAKRANPKAPHYSAAKAAVNMFSEGLAQQLKSKNIKMTTLNPGPTDTTFFEGRIPKEKRTRFMQAEDVAEVIEFILTREARIVFHDVQFESFEFFKG